VLFAAVHESLIGPFRHFDAAQQLGCFRSEADIDLGGSRRAFRVVGAAIPRANMRQVRVGHNSAQKGNAVC
jgi:hypothetical protein